MIDEKIKILALRNARSYNINVGNGVYDYPA